MIDPAAEAQIRTLVFAFYDRVREDDILGPVFNEKIGDGWAPHLEKMCDFWSTILYGTGRFRGHPVQTHAGLSGITSGHFDRWIELFDATAHEVLPKALADDIVGRSMRMRLVLERASVGAAQPGLATPATPDRDATPAPPDRA